VSRGQRNGSPRPYSRFSRPEPLLFPPSSSSIVHYKRLIIVGLTSVIGLLYSDSSTTEVMRSGDRMISN
jgi:hypothetical protein